MIEIRKIAVRFEEKTYASATSQVVTIFLDGILPDVFVFVIVSIMHRYTAKLG
ncbi:hypothetical protein QJS10_CPA07g00881 [Acorus calamus]|uniref:Uncharacterized protein n=1 Tax=Acorus calamus TaxID=4465 RepID=A0AAV9EF86_ACOCL|nr:hypothetical protein QJS10_CPA07g00881 [Acorus calamus]